jgi:hypothetical protein
MNESNLVDLLMNRDIEYKKRIVIEKWNKKNTGGSKEGRKSCFALLASWKYTNTKKKIIYIWLLSFSELILRIVL